MLNKPYAAFILSLIGGVFILLQIAIFFMFAFLFRSYHYYYYNMMVHPMFIYQPYIFTMSLAFILIGLISGVLVIIGSTMINSDDPDKIRTGGILVIVFSVISIISGGGFLVGFILGLIGGILAVIWHSPNITTSTQSKTQ